MMRTSYQPLAHRVDEAAERWLAAEISSEHEKQVVSDEITRAFRIGDNSALTFHGFRYLLSILRVDGEGADYPQVFRIKVHKIAFNE